MHFWYSEGLLSVRLLHGDYAVLIETLINKCKLSVRLFLDIYSMFGSDSSGVTSVSSNAHAMVLTATNFHTIVTCLYATRVEYTFTISKLRVSNVVPC